MKKTLLIVAVCFALALSAFAVTGCAKKEAVTPEPAAPTSTAPAWADQLVTPGGKVVLMGSDTNYPPFESPADSGGFQGFDVDLMTAIGEKMGLTFEFKTYNFDSLIAGLKTGTDFDMVMSAWTIKPERQKEVDFSTPYFRTSLGFAVPTDSALVSYKDLKAGDTVSIQLGSSAVDWAKANLPEGVKLKQFSDTLDCFNAMTAGDAVAVIQDLPVAVDIVKDPARKSKIAEEIAVEEYFGMGFAKNEKGAAMKADIEKALLEVVEDGTYAEIYKKWFLTDPTFVPGK